MVEIQTGVYSVQAKNTRLCVHIGSVAFFFGNRPGVAARLELFTHYHWFRWSWGKRDGVAYPDKPGQAGTQSEGHG